MCDQTVLETSPFVMFNRSHNKICNQEKSCMKMAEQDFLPRKKTQSSMVNMI